MALKVTGVPQVQQGIRRRAKEINDAVIQAFFMEGHAIMRVSLSRVPFATGALASSNVVSLDKRDRGVTVNLEYRESYAFYVHNINKNYNHGRSWMYLRGPVMEAQKGFSSRVAARARTLTR
jgi:hypothetical protein